MSGFQRKVLVYAPAGARAMSEAVQIAAKTVCERQQCEPVDSKAKGNRTIAIAATSKFVCVDDSEVRKGSDPGEWAHALSRTLKSPCVVVDVHDGEVLTLELFEHGSRIDKWVSRLDHFDELTDEDRSKLKGDARAWARTFKRPDLAESLHLFFEGGGEDATVLLGELDELLGMEGLSALGDDAAKQGTWAHAVNLHFRRRAAAPADAVTDVESDEDTVSSSSPSLAVQMLREKLMEPKQVQLRVPRKVLIEVHLYVDRLPATGAVLHAYGMGVGKIAVPETLRFEAAGTSQVLRFEQSVQNPGIFTADIAGALPPPPPRGPNGEWQRWLLGSLEVRAVAQGTARMSFLIQGSPELEFHSQPLTLVAV